jgi:hypothetical protein
VLLGLRNLRYLHDAIHEISHLPRVTHVVPMFMISSRRCDGDE